MIFIEIDDHAILLKNIAAVNIKFGKVYLVDGSMLQFKVNATEKLRYALKKMNGVTWITV